MADEEEFSQGEWLRQKRNERTLRNSAGSRSSPQTLEAGAEASTTSDASDIEALQYAAKQVEQDSLISTRNSLRTIRDSVALCDNNFSALQQQGERLDAVVDMAQAADIKANTAYESAKKMHKYKGLIPVSLKYMFSGGKKKGQDSELAKAQKHLDKEAKKKQQQANSFKERSESPQSFLSSSTSITTTATATTAKGSSVADGLDVKGSRPFATKGAQIDDLADNDDPEKEIQHNLEEITAGLGQLKATGLAMQSELARQDVTMKRINATTSHSKYVIQSAHNKIKEFT